MTHPHVEYALSLHGAYEEVELESLRLLVDALPAHSNIVEIGVLYGRSASIYMQASVAKPLNITLIDCWGVNGPDAEAAVRELRKLFPPVQVLKMRAEHAAPIVGPIDLLHIDGDHGIENITLDCQLYLPKLRSGGVAVFHDYHRDTPDGIVYPWIEGVVNEMTKGWEDLGVAFSQAKRRKP